MKLSEALAQHLLVSMINAEHEYQLPFLHSKSLDDAAKRGQISLPKPIMDRCREIAHLQIFPSVSHDKTGKLTTNIEASTTTSSEFLGSAELSNDKTTKALLNSFEDWRLYPYNTPMEKSEDPEHTATSIAMIYAK